MTELRSVIRYEATHNLRQVATLAGTLVACDGRAPLAAALLAMDASLTLLPGEDIVSLGDLLPVRAEILQGRLISQVELPANARLAFNAVSRTPADLPVVCVAVARWPSGRTRLAVGGYGDAPLVAFDGPDESGAEVAAGEAYSQAADQWASAEYRKEAAEVLARRGLAQLA
jgi:CO/xanthine dehydrogenase FAD-binding subunit